MRVSVSITGLDSILADKLAEIKVVAQGAMAGRFATIVDHNFGFDGEDRPAPWPALSPKYAKDFHGGNRIPTLVLSGDLQASIEIQDTNHDFSEVSTDCPYAEAHQFGEQGFLPARPFFPVLSNPGTMDGGKLTDYSEREVLAAAQNAVNKILA